MAKPRFLFLLNVAHRRVQSAVHGDVDGRTAVRAGLLMALDPDSAGTTMTRLAQALDLGASTLSGLVDRMVRDGLIERRADPADGRARSIGLTHAGMLARADAVRSARQLNDRLCQDFDATELAIVARWLGAVRTKFPKENDR